jgi:hypothetical protein
MTVTFLQNVSEIYDEVRASLFKCSRARSGPMSTYDSGLCDKRNFGSLCFSFGNYVHQGGPTELYLESYDISHVRIP